MDGNNCIDDDEQDFTVEDVIGVIPSMSLGLEKEYEKFENCIEIVKTCSRKYHSFVLDHRNSFGDHYNVLKSRLADVAEEISKNSHVLDEKKSEVEQLKKIVKDLNESNSQNEHQAETLKKKISNLRDKTEKLQEKRDKILVYKLLTNTNFCYDEDNVSGYVADPKTRKIKWFDLDPKKLSQKEITEKLYEVLKEVSHGTDIQNVEMDQKES